MSDRHGARGGVPAVLGFDAVYGRDPACPRRRDWLVALLDGERLQLARTGAEGGRPLARFRLDDPGAREDIAAFLAADGLRRLPLVLRLPPRAGLVFRDLLPACSARELGGLVAHRIALRTPFPAEAVLHRAWTVARRPDGRREVAVAVAPRRRVEEARDQLVALGLVPRVVDFAVGDPFAPPRFDLGRDPVLAGDRSRPLRRLAAAFAALALLAGGLFAWWGARERAEIARLDAAIAGLGRVAAPAPEEVARVEALRADLAWLDAYLAERPSPLSVLEATSRLLPDEVWLDSASLTGRDFVLSGYAASAGPLLRLFEDTPWFEATRFDAPSTRIEIEDPAGDLRVVERFTLATRVADPGAFEP